jgi:hypothetical protein
LLELYIHLDAISDKKVVHLIAEINNELAASLQSRWIKSLKSKIPVEEESELMKMMDDSSIQAIIKQ